MEIKKCLQQIYDIFKDFKRLFTEYPLILTSSSISDNINERGESIDFIRKEIIRKCMLNYIENLKDLEENFPEISNENILIANFLDIMFDEVI